MACINPLQGRRADDGSIKIFSSKGLIPLAYTPLTLPCGQCISCRLEHSRQWAVRCVHEAKMHKRNCFLTLTYSDEKMPEAGTLVLAHWQKFARRLRKLQAKIHLCDPTQPKSFRFYHCGEYGSKTQRAHYHALIFGLDFHDTRKKYRLGKKGHQLYTSEALDDLWSHGQVYIGDLTFESAAYVSRYTTKLVTGQAQALAYERVNFDTGEVIQIKPPYSTMSRNPGIGKTWLDKYESDVYPSDEVIVRGQPAKPPKYYDRQIKKKNPDLMVAIQNKRMEDAKIFLGDQSFGRNKARETIVNQRLKQSPRNLE